MKAFLRHLVTLVFLLVISPAHGGTHTWSGAGSNTLWSNAANWSSGGVPSAAESAPVTLIFPSNATGFTSTLNISNLKIDFIEIHVSSNAYTFPNGGVSIALTGASGNNIRLVGTSGSVTWSPAINLQSTVRISCEGTVSSLIDFQGILSGQGGITKLGAGTVSFSTGGAANSFTGPLRIENGRVNLAKIVGTPCFSGELQIISGTCEVNQSHQIPDTSPITMEGGLLMITPKSGVSSVSESLGPVTLRGSSQIRATSPNTVTLGSTVTRDTTTGTSTIKADSPSGEISLGGTTRTFNIASGKLTVIGNVVNGATTGSILKKGVAEMVIEDACSYSGSLTVEAGTVTIGDNLSLGTAAGATSVLANGVLKLGVIGQGAGLTLPAGETISVAGKIFANYSSEILGSVIASGSPLIASSAQNTLTLSGVISGSPSNLQFGEITNGTVKLSGTASNTFGGVATANLGTLELAKTNSLAIPGTLSFVGGTAKLLSSNQIADSGSLFFPTSSDGIFDMNGFAETLGYLFGTGNASFLMGSSTLTVSGNSSVTLGSTASQARFYGTTAAKLRKLGSGTFTLWSADVGIAAGNQTILSVESGVMDLRSNWPGEIQCVGGNLVGSAIVGPIKAIGGSVCLSDFKSSGFTGQNTGNVLVKLNGNTPGSGFDRMISSGVVNLTGRTLQLSMPGFVPTTSSGYRIIVNNSGSPVQGVFAGLPEGAGITLNGYPFRITYTGGDGDDVELIFVGRGTPGPEITKVTPKNNGTCEVTLKAPANAVVKLYSNPDLQSPWQYEGSHNVGAGGMTTATVGTMTAKRYFFRLAFLSY